MNSLNALEFARQRADILLLTAFGLILLLLALTAGLFARTRRLARQYRALTQGVDGRNLEEILLDRLNAVTDLSQRMERIEKMQEITLETQRGCLQRTGVVRFDAFEDVGGEQSFAVALLDAENSGVVLSSLFSRQDARVYAKAIEKGRASHHLTREEQLAMANADGK